MVRAPARRVAPEPVPLPTVQGVRPVMHGTLGDMRGRKAGRETCASTTREMTRLVPVFHEGEQSTDPFRNMSGRCVFGGYCAPHHVQQDISWLPIRPQVPLRAPIGHAPARARNDAAHSWTAPLDAQ